MLPHLTKQAGGSHTDTSVSARCWLFSEIAAPTVIKPGSRFLSLCRSNIVQCIVGRDERPNRHLLRCVPLAHLCREQEVSSPTSSFMSPHTQLEGKGYFQLCVWKPSSSSYTFSHPSPVCLLLSQKDPAKKTERNFKQTLLFCDKNMDCIHENKRPWEWWRHIKLTVTFYTLPIISMIAVYFFPTIKKGKKTLLLPELQKYQESGTSFLYNCSSAGEIR